MYTQSRVGFIFSIYLENSCYVEEGKCHFKTQLCPAVSSMICLQCRWAWSESKAVEFYRKVNSKRKTRLGVSTSQVKMNFNGKSKSWVWDRKDEEEKGSRSRSQHRLLKTQLMKLPGEPKLFSIRLQGSCYVVWDLIFTLPQTFSKMIFSSLLYAHLLPLPLQSGKGSCVSPAGFVNRVSCRRNKRRLV